MSSAPCLSTPPSWLSSRDTVAQVSFGGMEVEVEAVELRPVTSNIVTGVAPAAEPAASAAAHGGQDTDEDAVEDLREAQLYERQHQLCELAQRLMRVLLLDCDETKLLAMSGWCAGVTPA